MREKFILVLICFILPLLALFSCGEDKETPTSPETGANQSKKEPITPQTGGDQKAPVSFAKDVFPILKKECAVIGCHVPPNPEGGLDQSSYDKLMRGGNSGKAIIAGNAADSLLVKRIEGRIQPQMPFGGVPLPKEEINKIKQWIAEGAKNN